MCKCLNLSNGELLMCQVHSNELNWWRKRFMDQRDEAWREVTRLRQIIEDIHQAVRPFEMISDAIKQSASVETLHKGHDE